MMTAWNYLVPEIFRATAQRWLNALIEKRLIERIGRTRNLRYRRMENR